jgi:hypothetical protein
MTKKSVQQAPHDLSLSRSMWNVNIKMNTMSIAYSHDETMTFVHSTWDFVYYGGNESGLMIVGNLMWLNMRKWHQLNVFDSCQNS